MQFWWKFEVITSFRTRDIHWWISVTSSWRHQYRVFCKFLIFRIIFQLRPGRIFITPLMRFFFAIAEYFLTSLTHAAFRIALSMLRFHEITQLKKAFSRSRIFFEFTNSRKFFRKFTHSRNKKSPITQSRKPLGGPL